MEVSPYNSRARRAKGGIWNGDVLPIMEWEAAEHRMVVPEDLQRALGIDTPVLTVGLEEIPVCYPNAQS